MQNGRFDSPDRLFASVAEAWESVVSAPADVKELLPEFFLPGGAFMLNSHNLALGSRQNGCAETWAQGSCCSDRSISAALYYIGLSMSVSSKCIYAILTSCRC